MPIQADDITESYIIKSFERSLERGDRKISKTVSTPGDGSFTVAFSGRFGSGMTDEVLRISDGSTTIDYTTAPSGGGDASGAAQIGIGGDRSCDDAVDEFVSKINASALDITAVDLGGDADAASFKLTPGSGKTVTVTEDPGGNNQFGNPYGDETNFTTITAAGGSTTTEARAAPFRFSQNNVSNLRSQSNNNSYKSFLGDHKS